jgi:pyruvate/2-oxoglutarate dehydrogenase complex dihydrolipoamide acyltransferase (E2) component
MKGRKVSGWRKIAEAQWGPPTDPQIYGDLDIEATAALRFIKKAEKAGTKLTITHLAGKAVGVALKEHPDLNTRLYRHRFVPRETADIFFIVSAGAGSELSGVKVVDAGAKPVVEIAAELATRAGRIRADDDVELGKTKKMLGSTPPSLLKLSMRAAAWLTVDRDIELKRFGLPRQAFGSALVTSVGMFGIQHAYAPLAAHYRVPFLILVGELADRAVVRGGKVVARPMFTISATMDHRYVDGFHAARLAKTTQAYLADPEAYEPPL